MKGWDWAGIAKKIDARQSPFYTTAGLLGKMKLEPGQTAKAAKLFGLTKLEEKLLAEVPYRGTLPPGPPTDPLIYRFYELFQVYGTHSKALIHDDFRDDLMSAIAFVMKKEIQTHPKRDPHK